jgi:hypothetical protein
MRRSRLNLLPGHPAVSADADCGFLEDQFVLDVDQAFETSGRKSSIVVLESTLSGMSVVHSAETSLKMRPE